MCVVVNKGRRQKGLDCCCSVRCVRSLVRSQERRDSVLGEQAFGGAGDCGSAPAALDRAAVEKVNGYRP